MNNRRKPPLPSAGIPWPKILTGITILVFCLQLSGQYGLFVQLPERVKVVLDKIEEIEDGMHSGRTRHAQTEKDIESLKGNIVRIVQRFDEFEKRIHEVERVVYQKVNP